MDVVAIGTVATIILAGFAWRFASRRANLPCPAWLAWLFESPVGTRLMDPRRTLNAMQLSRGMSVLDAGCGSGRVSVELAKQVGWEGGVLAVDMQPAMLRKTAERAEKLGLDNIHTHCTRLGAGRLPRDQFDRAILVCVLGEIPERVAALREIADSLKPGGLLAVAEVFPDPHYQSRASVVRFLESAGLTVVEQVGSWWAHTTVARREK